MPRCSPESAKICEAPLLRKASSVSLGIPLRSPVISASIIWFVAMFLNGRFPILDFKASPRSEIWSGSKELLCIWLIDRILWVNPVKSPHPTADRIMKVAIIPRFQLWWRG